MVNHIVVPPCVKLPIGLSPAVFATAQIKLMGGWGVWGVGVWGWGGEGVHCGMASQ